MIARSITFCNSRMFPGQSYSSISFAVRFSTCLIFLAALAA